MKVVILPDWLKNEGKIHAMLVIFFTVQQDSLKFVIKWVKLVKYATGYKHDARRRDCKLE